ncbi:YbhB/YbcL family Raf kinase inhibitor-like protein [Acidaminobacter hydrogenoformans]|uniref:Phospholipid-binding protein, PBP family n=1 Tax=Acidaminobacter hydrogenoformans DSM 2784 TaxID=1120920 RepID=A0A1G5RZW7_9FIRM|nr:YbhB/YbcL family Raf kinase inhibitor-like protein [Acidaminobacter hydrogenoformans]SCZ79662.1 hypothetical protein SAMN03080599_01877 [Acidaminobacter hydrogenoformans DSM 2784]
MKISSTGIVNGKIEDRFGKRGNEFFEGKIATRSLPFKIEAAPVGTRSFAFVLEDKDAVPVCGYSWIHWVGANLTRGEVAENESRMATDFVQGATSWSGLIYKMDRLATSFYGGMAPPDKAHVYELHVYALDTLLELEPGFYMNELYKQMEGHILGCATLKGVYDA